MDWILALFVGLITGVLFTWFWFSINGKWKTSKDLKSSSAKARKEQIEKALKAKQDAKKSRDAAFRTLTQFILFVLAVIAMGWVIWMFVRL